MTELSQKRGSKLIFKTFKTSDLIEYARNPRNNDAVVDKMVGCIKEFGFRIPIVAKSDGSVVDGHLRLKAARKLGLDAVPVVIADDLSEAQIKAFRLIANQSANWADWDKELLKLEFQELEKLNFDLSLTGFDLDEIAAYLKEDEEVENPAEDFKENNLPITSKVGDLWILGRHRLLCGDSTNSGDVQKLMNGKFADMIFTDPPYNVKVSNISGINKEHKHSEFLMASGEMSVQEFIDFLSKIFKNLVSFSKNGSLHYVCMDWKHIYEILTAAKENYSDFKQLCIWNKGVGGMGNFYRSQHELIFVFKNGEEKHINNFHLGETGRYRTNVWSYSENSCGGKPVPLIADAILDCSHNENIILDPFGKSGTALIACEETDRICCMMESDPKLVDAIIRRWQRHTGESAILESNGKSFEELGE